MAKTATATDILASGPAAEARITTHKPAPYADLGALFEGETAELRTFSSGKSGYGFYGKLKVGAKRVQCSVNLVIIEDK
jgi:hypothetical protein